MNVRCEFKLKEKIDVIGIDLNDNSLDEIKAQLIDILRKGGAEINCVEYYEPDEEDPNAEPEELAQIDGTYFDINIDLDISQIETWKDNKEIIFEKTIKQLESEKLYISSLWGRDDEQHIGFIKDDL